MTLIIIAVLMQLELKEINSLRSLSNSQIKMLSWMVKSWEGDSENPLLLVELGFGLALIDRHWEFSPQLSR